MLVQLIKKDEREVQFECSELCQDNTITIHIYDTENPYYGQYMEFDAKEINHLVEFLTKQLERVG